MKDKTPLVLMEQLILVLVFGLAAAICLQVFLFSDRLSNSNATRDQAVLVAQNAAEEWRAGADLSEPIYYDMEWNRLDSPERGRYRVDVTERKGEEELTSLADVTVTEVDGELIFSMSTARQEDGI